MLLGYGCAALTLLLLAILWWPWLRQRNRRIGLGWPLSFSVAALLLPALGYLQLGSYVALQQETLRLEKQRSAMQDSDSSLLNLQQRIRQAPERGELWFDLSQQYLYHNQFSEALVALQQVERLEGDSAGLNAARATVLYYQAGQRLTPEVTYWLEQALSKEPLQYTALMLQATDSFTQGRYAEASEIWQRLLDSTDPNIDRAAVIRALSMARMMQQP